MDEQPIKFPDGSEGILREGKRLDFTEEAEAVGCATDLILTVVRGGDLLPPGMIAVFYTPEYETNQDDGMVAVLNRDPDGILRVVKKVAQPGLLREFREHMNDAIDRLEGDDQ